MPLKIGIRDFTVRPSDPQGSIESTRLVGGGPVFRVTDQTRLFLSTRVRSSALGVINKEGIKARKPGQLVKPKYSREIFRRLGSDSASFSHLSFQDFKYNFHSALRSHRLHPDIVQKIESEAYYHLGLLRKNGSNTAAREVLEKLLQLDRKNLRVHTDLCDVLGKLHDEGSIKKHILQVLRRSPLSVEDTGRFFQHVKNKFRGTCGTVQVIQFWERLLPFCAEENTHFLLGEISELKIREVDEAFKKIELDGSHFSLPDFVKYLDSVRKSSSPEMDPSVVARIRREGGFQLQQLFARNEFSIALEVITKLLQIESSNYRLNVIALDVILLLEKYDLAKGFVREMVPDLVLSEQDTLKMIKQACDAIGSKQGYTEAMQFCQSLFEVASTSQREELRKIQMNLLAGKAIE
jgi:hypothetical protein